MSGWWDAWVVEPMRQSWRNVVAHRRRNLAFAAIFIAIAVLVLAGVNRTLMQGTFHGAALVYLLFFAVNRRGGAFRSLTLRESLVPAVVIGVPLLFLVAVVFAPTD